MIRNPVQRPTPIQRLLKKAIVDLNADGIEHSGGLVTAWRNRADLSSDFDLDTIVGTAADLQYHAAGTTTGFAGINNANNGALETSTGQLIGLPFTAFYVVKASEVAGVFQRIVAANSVGTQNPSIFITSTNNWGLNAGSNIELTGADTDLHAISLQHNGDGSTTLSVSGVGSVQADAGSEPWDFGTAFASRSGTSPFKGLFFRLLVFPFKLRDTEHDLLNNHLVSYYDNVA